MSPSESDPNAILVPSTASLAILSVVTTPELVSIEKLSVPVTSCQVTVSSAVAVYTVTPVEAPFEELLTYRFGNITDNSVVGFLHWEKLKIPFQITLN